MQENDKNRKKIGKKQFLMRKQQRDPQRDGQLSQMYILTKMEVWFGFQDLNPSERK